MMARKPKIRLATSTMKRREWFGEVARRRIWLEIAGRLPHSFCRFGVVSDDHHYADAGCVGVPESMQSLSKMKPMRIDARHGGVAAEMNRMRCPAARAP